jgi:hypothetical protein
MMRHAAVACAALAAFSLPARAASPTGTVDQLQGELAGIDIKVTCAPPPGIVLLGVPMETMKLTGILALPPWRPEWQKLRDLEAKESSMGLEESQLRTGWTDSVPALRATVDSYATRMAELQKDKGYYEKSKAEAQAGDAANKAQLIADYDEWLARVNADIAGLQARYEAAQQKLPKMEQRLAELQRDLKPLRAETALTKQAALAWVKKCIEGSGQ